MNTTDNRPGYEDESQDDHRLAEELESLYQHVVQIDQPDRTVEKTDDPGSGPKIEEIPSPVAGTGFAPIGNPFQNRPRAGERRYSWRGEVRRKKQALVLKKAGFVILILMSLLAGSMIIGFSPAGWKGFPTYIVKFKNRIAFMILPQKPHFYALTLEKNGRDFDVTPQDTLEVSAGDKFIIKGVSTDAIFGDEVRVHVRGIGEQNEFRMPLKGIDLIDKAVLNGRDRQENIKPGDFSLQIAYRGEGIASIPVRILIDPRDWLSYARYSGNLKARIEYLKRAINLSPNEVSVRKMLASAYLQAGMNEEAIARYEEILFIKPDDEASQADMAAAWGNRGNWKEAIVSYRAALKIRPDNPVVIFRLGEAYEKANELDKAAEQYRLVLAMMPKAENVAFVLAHLSMKIGNVDEAIRWYLEIAKQHPENARAYANLAQAYGKKGLAQEEIHNYRKAVALNPRDSLNNFNLGDAYERKGLFAEALNSYTNALHFNPGFMQAAQKIQQMQELINRQKREGEPGQSSKTDGR